MDLRLNAADEAFRDEVRQFLRDNLEGIAEPRVSSHAISSHERMMRWHAKLYAKGWIAPSWPEEHGGTGWNDMQRYIFATECSLAGAPHTAPFGLGMCGPVLMAYGSDEQKSYYLPRILSGEDYWCQGYSEPGSGSDLASLKTRAEPDGDDYIVNGQKIWTTHAHHATNIFLLVRTDTAVKPQAGISFLLLDMDMPGITVEPIITLAGEHEVNQVFFDNVRVPRTRLVGGENQGWTIAKYLLQFERSHSYASSVKVVLADIRCIADLEPVGDGGPLSKQADFKRQLDELDIALCSLDTWERRVMSELSAGQNPGARTSMMKALGTELLQRATELNMLALAYYAAPAQPGLFGRDAGAELIGAEHARFATAAYCNDRAASIYAGSNEIQRNIVATAVLGL